MSVDHQMSETSPSATTKYEKVVNLKSPNGFNFEIALPTPLGSDEVGLIFSPVQIENDEHSFSAYQSYDLQDLRSSLVLFDRLDFPVTFIASHTTDAEFLAGEGVLQRTVVRHADEGVFEMAEVLGLSTIAALVARQKQSPGNVWSLGSNERTALPSFTQLQTYEGIGLALHPIIPVPDKDVPLAEILDFRTRRYSERHALNYFLRALYASIADDPERPLAEQVAIKQLGAAISDHTAAMKKFRFPLRLAGLKAKIELKVTPATIPAMFAAYQNGLSLNSVALAGLGLISFSASKELVLRSAAVTGSPVEYIGMYHRELFAV